MNKFLLLVVLISIFSLSPAQEVKRLGNTFMTVASSTVSSDVQTPYTWKDKDGITYPIFMTKKGACYIKRISKKTGQEYKYYLPKQVQEQIRKELGM